MKWLTYLVNCLDGLLGADAPGQRPESVRGDHMTITPALLCRRVIRPRRAVRNPWAFHSRAFDLRARDLPWAG